MKPALLAEILRDPALVAERCVQLRDALPHANVSQMVSLQPSLLLEVSTAHAVPDEGPTRWCLDSKWVRVMPAKRWLLVRVPEHAAEAVR